MKIARFEHLHADAGWRVFSFLKIVTDEGLVGWAEYNEGYGAGGVTALLRKFAADRDRHGPARGRPAAA